MMTRSYRLAAAGAAAVLAGFAMSANASNLLVNPGFEGDGPSASVSVPTGWTSDAAYNLHPSFNFVTNNPVFVYAGARALSISNYEYEATPHLFQTFADVVGATYYVSFYATSLFGGAGAFLDVSAGGSDLALHGTLPAYTLYSFNFVGTGSDTLSIGAANSQGYYYVDGVSVEGLSAGVPEPATWAMMLVGFGGLGAAIRRRRSQAALAAA